MMFQMLEKYLSDAAMIKRQETLQRHLFHREE